MSGAFMSKTDLKIRSVRLSLRYACRFSLPACSHWGDLRKHGADWSINKCLKVSQVLIGSTTNI